jgi:hypothetical protein
MEVFILISVVFIMRVAANRTVEQECLECVNEKKMTFYKTVWASKDPSEYSCRKYAYSVSTFGYVVDTACIESECQNITLRPLLHNSRRYGYFYCQTQQIVDSSNHHAKVVQTVRDYLEIVLLSVVCGILVLKKQLLIDCIKSHRRNQASNCIQVEDDMESTRLLTRNSYRMKQLNASKLDSIPESTAP